MTALLGHEEWGPGCHTAPYPWSYNNLLEWLWQPRDVQEYSKNQPSRDPAGLPVRTTTFWPPWWWCCLVILVSDYILNLPVAKYICKVHILSLINEARNSERNLFYVTIEGNLGINPVLPTCPHQNVTICGTHLLPGSYTQSTLISY